MTQLTDVELPMPGGRTCDAIVATHERARPGVLLLMDAVGLRARLRDMIAELAGHGYAVLAPNVFHRAGRQPLVDPALLTAERRPARMARFAELFGALTPADWALDGPVYLDHLAGLPDVTDEPARIVGYCMGGRLGLTLAARCPDRVQAVAGFHPGDLVTDTPDSPHRLLTLVQARLLFGYADEDGSMTPEQQADFAAAAAAAGRELTAACYPGALHGYTMADLPAYDADATARHWRELVAFFAG